MRGMKPALTSSYLRAATASLVTAALVLLAGGCGDDGSDLPAVEGPVSPRLELHATEMAYDPDAIAV